MLPVEEDGLSSSCLIQIRWGIASVTSTKRVVDGIGCAVLCVTNTEAVCFVVDNESPDGPNPLMAGVGRAGMLVRLPVDKGSWLLLAGGTLMFCVSTLRVFLIICKLSSSSEVALRMASF